MQRETFTKVSGKIIRRMGLGSMSMLMESLSLVTEQTTNKKDLGKRCDPIAVIILEIIIKGRNKDLGHSIEQMGHIMKESLMATRFQEVVVIYGKTEGNIKASGLKTKCMELELSNDQMAGNISGNIYMIKKMALVLLNGQMGSIIRECGKMESKTEKVGSSLRIKPSGKAFEKMGKSLNGSGLGKLSKAFRKMVVFVILTIDLFR